MRRLQTCLLGVLLLSLSRDVPDGRPGTIRQLDDLAAARSGRSIRGTQYAVSSMKLQATEAAVRILEAGGNAFDAAVAGQAVLALVNPESNGFGADAVVLVYDAREKKVHSINAEGTAPKLATIDWYNKNNGGRIPNSDGLLSASLPGVIDAWYIMLDRWGTMTFAQVLERAIDVAENGFPIGEGLSRAIAGSKKIRQYPTTMKVYFPNGRAPQPGELFRNPDSARMLRKLVDAEKGRGRQGPARGAARRARSLLQGRHRQDDGRFLREKWRPLSLRGFRRLHGQGRDAGFDELSWLRGLQEHLLVSGSRRALHAEHPRRLRPQDDGAQQRRVHPYQRRSAQARVCGSRAARATPISCASRSKVSSRRPMPRSAGSSSIPTRLRWRSARAIPNGS